MTAELAARQHGVVGRAQLVALGLGRSGIRSRLRSGRLHRIWEGVYAVGQASLTRQGRWMAAVLACGPGAVLSHWSAAELWRIRQPSGGAIHVTSPQKSSASWQFVRHHSSLPADEVTFEDGIPVTGVPRTLLDLAAVASADVVDFALRESEFRRLFSPLSLPDMIDRYPGRRGVRTARLALIRRSERPLGRPRSPLEEVFVPFSAATASRSLSSTTCSKSRGTATRSSASGPSPARSSSSTAGRDTAPASPSAKTAPATAASGLPATPSPGSPGPSSKTNQRRSPPICARFY